MIFAAAHHSLAIRRECEGTNGRAVPASGSQRSVRMPQVPELDRVRSATRHHRCSIARDGQSRDATLVLAANPAALIRDTHIPKPDFLVSPAACEAASIRSEAERQNGVVMAFVSAKEPSGIDLHKLNPSALVAERRDARI